MPDAPILDMARYRGALPFIVVAEGVATLAGAPAPNMANRGKFFLVATIGTLDSALTAAGAVAGSLGLVNVDAYGPAYIFRAPRLGDIVARPKGELLRYQDVRRADVTTSQNVTTQEWVLYRSQPQRALDGMMVFDQFDPDKVYDYYATLVGSVLAQLQVTNRDMARWRDPQLVPAEYLELSAASIGARFQDSDPVQLRRNKVETAIPASRTRGLADSAVLRLRQTGYLGHITESWQQHSMEDWANPLPLHLPKYQQVVLALRDGASPVNGTTVTIQVAELYVPAALYMTSAVTLTFSGSILNESQGNAVAGVVQGATLASAPCTPFSVVITVNDSGNTYVCRDDGAGNLVGDVAGTINYTTGLWSVTFAFGLAGGSGMTASYLKTSVTAPLVLIGLTPRATLDNLVSVIQTYAPLSAHVTSGAYPGEVPRMLIQSLHLFTATNNPALTVSSSSSSVSVVNASFPSESWIPPSREIRWAVVHLARLTNDSQLSITAQRSDGIALFPFIMTEVIPGDDYRRSRAAITFYDNYVPVSGDKVIVTFGGVTTVFTYGSGVAIPVTGVPYNDSHQAAENLLAALVTAYGGGATVSRSPVAFTCSVGVGETGAGYDDPNAEWVERQHGDYVGEPAIRAPTSLVSVHLNALNGGQILTAGPVPPNPTLGAVGPFPPMDPVRQAVLAELVPDLLPVNVRVRQWLTDVLLPTLNGDGDMLEVSDTLAVS